MILDKENRTSGIRETEDNLRIVDVLEGGLAGLELVLHHLDVLDLGPANIAI